MPKVKYKKNGDWNDLDFSSGGSGSASIDDTNTSVDKTWSSDKINKQFQTIANDLKNLQASGLTTEQIEALDNMFKICGYVKDDVSVEYEAFKTAFGITTAITNYTVTNTLNNATNSNNSTSITEGSSYNATVTPNTGYILDSVVVKMGGLDITSTSYNNGEITISEVTGDIEIIVTTTQQSTTVVSYSITNNLTNCINSNTNTSAEENASYSAIITADEGYTLNSVVITMGGTDITDTTYADGNINISSVTGNIVIIAKSMKQSDINYTLDAFNDVTWSNGYLYDNTTGELTSVENHHCTSKFTPQTSLYKLSKGGSYQTLYEWDENDVFCGAYAVNINSNLYMSLLKTHKYAISIYSTDFDSSLVTLLPVDNSSSAVEQTIIDLSILTESDMSESNKEINLTSLYPNIEINNTNFATVIQNTNFTVMMKTPNSGARVVNKPLFFMTTYGSNLLLQIWGFDSIAETIAYLQTNEVKLIIN